MALLTRQVTAPDVSRDAVLGDNEDAELLRAMEPLAAGLIGATLGDQAAGVLQDIGLRLAAMQGAGRPARARQVQCEPQRLAELPGWAQDLIRKLRAEAASARAKARHAAQTGRASGD